MTKRVGILCSNPPAFHCCIFILSSVLNVNLGLLHSMSNSKKISVSLSLFPVRYLEHQIAV